MDVVLQVILSIVFVVEFMIGNFGNGFIVLVNCMDWVRRKKISPVDQILTALAISRIALLWVVFLDWWMSVLYPASLITENMLRMICIAWTLTSHFNNWLATSLSIFYFLKITIFSNSLFLYLKWRVTKVIQAALLVSLIFLFLNTILTSTYLETLMNGPNRNTSYNFRYRNFAQFSRLFLFPQLIFISIPFAMSLKAFLLFIFSLWRHHKNMQHNNQGCRDARTTAHIRVLQTIIVFLLFYASFTVSLVTHVWAFGMEKNLIILFGNITLTAFPSGHSCVLILGNNKLRQTLMFLPQRLKCRFKDADTPGS